MTTPAPTPEAIEAAEAAMGQRMTWASLHWNALDPNQQRELANAALTAAYPLMEAQAKAEALREAADAVNADCADEAGECFCGSSDWLRARAATIEGKSE